VPANASEDDAHLPEAAARRVLLLRDVERGGVGAAHWSAEDAAWATRLARETAPGVAAAAGATGRVLTSAQWLDHRATQAWQRLAPRDRRLAALAERGLWRSFVPLALPAALAVGAAAGLAADGFGARSQVIDLLSPAWLGLLGWNLLVYGWLFVGVLGRPSRPGWLRRLAARLAAHGGRGAAAPGFAADWATRTAGLTAARAASLLHLAAAAFAAGMVASLYLRGLVLDFRAGWQSTFLDAQAVHMLLAALLAPASAASGVAVPDAAALAALRVGGGQAAAASAAPWIHLFAATLGLFVVVPRLLLAGRAAAMAWWRGRRIVLPLAEPYFQRLLQQARSARARIVVLPHGSTPSAQAALALRELVVQALGDDARLDITRSTPYGDEDGPLPAAGTGTTWRLALFDLASTPEPEAQGRFVQALRGSGGEGALLLLVDEAAARTRLAALPERLAERRAAWQRFAAEAGVPLALVDLAAPEAADAAALERVLAEAR
jgi:hypothetical protein